MRQLRARSGLASFHCVISCCRCLWLMPTQWAISDSSFSSCCCPSTSCFSKFTISSLASILVLAAAVCVSVQTSMLNTGENRRGSWDIGKKLLGFPQYTHAAIDVEYFADCDG